MGRAPVLGRPATAAEAEYHERSFLAAFVPERLQAQALTCFSHRRRPRQQYQNDWSGFVCHLPIVPAAYLTELHRAAEIEAAAAVAAGGWVFLMAHGDWDARIVSHADFVRIATTAVEPHDFVASLVAGRAALWRGEDGVFSVARPPRAGARP